MACCVEAKELEELKVRGFITDQQYEKGKELLGAQFPSGSGKFRVNEEESPQTAGFALQIRDSGWNQSLENERNKPYFKEIIAFLERETKKKKKIFPPKHEIFAALDLTPLNQVKAVILGQDPYHDDYQAHGLCFSVKPGVAIPPSLKNMYKELAIDIPGFHTPKHGCLVKWAREGVLLLNATLTVEAHKANSHASCGWQTLTDKIIELVNNQLSGVVFILLGAFAQKKGASVDRQKHCVIQAAHPSPLSASKFFGCKVFSKTNDYLVKTGRDPINWHLGDDPMYQP